MQHSACQQLEWQQCSRDRNTKVCCLVKTVGIHHRGRLKISQQTHFNPGYSGPWLFMTFYSLDISAMHDWHHWLSFPFRMSIETLSLQAKSTYRISGCGDVSKCTVPPCDKCATWQFWCLDIPRVLWYPWLSFYFTCRQGHEHSKTLQNKFTIIAFIVNISHEGWREQHWSHVYTFTMSHMYHKTVMKNKLLDTYQEATLKIKMLVVWYRFQTWLKEINTFTNTSLQTLVLQTADFHG